MTHEFTRKGTRIYTKTSRSFVFCFVLFSVSIVFSFVLFRVPSTEAAELFLLPQQSIVGQNDTFLVEVRLDTEGEQINAVEARLVFPQDDLEVVGLERGGSLLSLWPDEPAFDNTQGTITFVGGTPTPFLGQDGLVGRILFRAKATGQDFSLEISERSRVLLADGRGTPAKLTTLSGVFDVLPAPPSIITSPSHPDQLKWSRERTIVLHWEAPPGSNWSYLLTKDPAQEPDDISDQPVGDIKFENLEDGIYYFSLCEIHETTRMGTRNDTNVRVGSRGEAIISCGFVYRQRVMIDATPPEQFEVQFSEGTQATKGYPFLSFNTTDITSGIRSYALCGQTQEPSSLSLDSQEQSCQEVQPPVLLTKKDFGERLLIVRAFDLAGNVREATVQLPASKPPLKESIAAIIIGIALLIGMALLSRIPRVRSAVRVLWGGPEQIT